MSGWEQSARDRLARADLLSPHGHGPSAARGRERRETLLELREALAEIDRLRGLTPPLTVHEVGSIVVGGLEPEKLEAVVLVGPREALRAGGALLGRRVRLVEVDR